jgi:hypothetical protein
VSEKEDLVQLEGPGGWKVPHRWVDPSFPVLIRDGRDRPVGLLVHASAELEMHGTRAVFQDLHLDPLLAGGFTAEDLANVDWDLSITEAIWAKAAEVRLKASGAPLPYKIPSSGAEREQVHRAVRTAQRKNGVTTERLEEVLRVHDAEGIEGVMQATGKSRSYSYQLLNRARKELR